MPTDPITSEVAQLAQLPKIDGVVGIAVVTAAAIAFGIRKEWLEHKKHLTEAHFAKIVQVNNFYRQYLKGGRVLEVEFLKLDSVEFPIPFTLDNEEKPTKAECNGVTASFLQDIVDITPTYPDPRLAPCFRNFLNALNYLLELLQVEKDDIARSEIEFMMLMIALHCVNFTGAEKNIAYTHQLAEFVNAIASIHAPGEKATNDELKRFQHLTLVYGELENAEILLVEHINKRSHEELISTSLPYSSNLLDKMIKNMVKFTVKEEHYSAVDSTTMQRLSINVVKPKFDHDAGFFARLFRTPRAFMLKESPFQQWIDECAKNYLLAETIKCGKTSEDFPISNVSYIDRHKRYPEKAIKFLEMHKDHVLNDHQLKNFEGMRYFSVSEIETLRHKLLTEADFIDLVKKGFFSPKTMEDLTQRGLREGTFQNCYLTRHELDELSHARMFTPMLIKELEQFKKTTLTEGQIKILEKEHFTEWEMIQLRQIFKENNNFLTLRPQVNGVLAATTFQPIVDDAAIIERAKVLSDYAGLINKLSILEHFEFYLWSRVKQLGEIYISDPHHCNFLFGVLTGLGDQLNKDAKALLDKINNIQHENALSRAMHPSERLALIQQCQKFVGRVSSEIAPKVKLIAERHEKRSPNSEAVGEIDIEKDKMYKLGADISATFGLSVKHKLVKGSEVSRASSVPSLSLEQKEPLSPDSPVAGLTVPMHMTDDPRLLLMLAHFHSPDEVIKILKTEADAHIDEHKEDHHDDALPVIPPVTHLSLTDELNKDKDKDKEKDKEGANQDDNVFVSSPPNIDEQISKDVTMDQFTEKLQAVRAEMLSLPKGMQRNYCMALYNAFEVVHTHIECLDKEDRNEKAGDLRCVMMEVLDDTHEFLVKNKSENRRERKQAAEDFAAAIHTTLTAEPYKAAIDSHASLLSRLVCEIVSCALIIGFVKAYQRGGFLRTESRAEMNQIESLSNAVWKASPIVVN